MPEVLYVPGSDTVISLDFYSDTYKPIYELNIDGSGFKNYSGFYGDLFYLLDFPTSFWLKAGNMNTEPSFNGGHSSSLYDLVIYPNGIWYFEFGGDYIKLVD